MLLVTFIYLVISIGYVLINKVILSGDLDLHAPLFFTWLQTIITALGCAILAAARIVLDPIQEAQFLPQFEYSITFAYQVFPASLAYIGMIVVNNLCLENVNVSYFTIAKWSAVVIYAMMNKKRGVFACLIVLIGYFIVSLEQSLINIVFGISSSFFVAVFAHSLQKSGNNSWRVLYYCNIHALMIIPILMVVVGEADEIYWESHAFSNSSFWILSIFAGIFNFLLNIVTFIQIQTSGSYKHIIVVGVKACIQIALAYLIFGDEITFFKSVGYALLLIGTHLYARLRIMSRKPSKLDDGSKIYKLEIYAGEFLEFESEREKDDS
jgi:solute carrier family 35 (GDP-fucose transporter), member C1